MNPMEHPFSYEFYASICCTSRPAGRRLGKAKSTPLASAGRLSKGDDRICRSIRTLYNIEPLATEEEIRAAALQFIRKISGFNASSQANAPAFARAVDEIADTASKLLLSLETSRPPRDREIETAKAKERSRYTRIV